MNFVSIVRRRRKERKNVQVGTVIDDSMNRKTLDTCTAGILNRLDAAMSAVADTQLFLALAYVLQPNPAVIYHIQVQAHLILIALYTPILSLLTMGGTLHSSLNTFIRLAVLSACFTLLRMHLYVPASLGRGMQIPSGSSSSALILTARCVQLINVAEIESEFCSTLR